jgi:recombination protein RecR
MSFTPATEKLIQALQMLPGVGVRSAQRMALQLLERDPDSALALNESLQNAIDRVKKCPSCRTLTETDLCDICSDESRDLETICVVANDADKSGIEMSGKYSGRYFVLHGVLSPIDGIGPEELGIFDLIETVKQTSVKEVVLALDEQMESEATVHYLTEHLKTTAVRISRVQFHKMKSGSLDTVESHVIGNALASKKEIGFELD